MKTYRERQRQQARQRARQVLAEIRQRQQAAQQDQAAQEARTARAELAALRDDAMARAYCAIVDERDRGVWRYQHG